MQAFVMTKIAMLVFMCCALGCSDAAEDRDGAPYRALAVDADTSEALVPEEAVVAADSATVLDTRAAKPASDSAATTRDARYDKWDSYVDGYKGNYAYVCVAYSPASQYARNCRYWGTPVGLCRKAQLKEGECEPTSEWLDPNNLGWYCCRGADSILWSDQQL